MPAQDQLSQKHESVHIHRLFLPNKHGQIRMRVCQLCSQEEFIIHEHFNHSHDWNEKYDHEIHEHEHQVSSIHEIVLNSE
jgi:hypothetical protein